MDIWTGEGIWEGWRLTTDHSASSYGQPVLIDPQGRAYGPGDIITLDDVLTVPAAAVEWEKATEPTLKRYLAEGRFGSDARKVGGTWFVTRRGMKKIFGDPS